MTNLSITAFSWNHVGLRNQHLFVTGTGSLKRTLEASSVSIETHVKMLQLMYLESSFKGNQAARDTSLQFWKSLLQLLNTLLKVYIPLYINMCDSSTYKHHFWSQKGFFMKIQTHLFKKWSCFTYTCHRRDLTTRLSNGSVPSIQSRSIQIHSEQI